MPLRGLVALMLVGFVIGLTGAWPDAHETVPEAPPGPGPRRGGVQR